MNDTVAVMIRHGFPEELRRQSAELFDAAFGAKLGIAIPNTNARLAVLSEAFGKEHCFVALSGDEIVGIAGFHTSSGSLTGGITFGRLRAHLGWLGAIRAYGVCALFDRTLTEGELLMDGISVAPKMRGQGIGTLLLSEVQRYACVKGYRRVRLDVIDTNPSAMRLYERVGFAAGKTVKFGWLRWFLGFGASTTMYYEVTPGATSEG